MSYDIGLYKRTFLKKAVEQNLGDWTNADPLEPHVIESVKTKLITLGFILDCQSDLSTEFIHPNEQWGVQVSLSSGEISFSAPYWDHVDSAVEEATRIAKEIANEFDLGFHDPQIGTEEF
jgi:hypothetical protein